MVRPQLKSTSSFGRMGTKRGAWGSVSSVGLVLALAACGDGDDGNGASSALDRGAIGRYLLGDDAGTVRVVDVAKGKQEGEFELGAPGSLYDTGDGRHFLAKVDELGLVTFLDAGVSYTDHVDHDHVRLDTPLRLPLDLTGADPGAVFSNQGKTVVHFDGSSSEQPHVAAMSRADFDESDFGPQTTEVTATSPVAGLGLPFAGFLLVSDGAAGDPALPTGFRITDFAGETYATFADQCLELRDAAPAPDSPRAVVACADQLVVVESLGGAMFEQVMLNGAADGAGVERLVWDAGLPWVLGLADGGERRVWVDAGDLTVQAESGAPVVFAGVAARAEPTGMVLVRTDGAIELAKGPTEFEVIAPAGTVPVDESTVPASQRIAIGYDTLFFLDPTFSSSTVVVGVRLDDGEVFVALEMPDVSSSSLALSGPAHVPLGDMGFDDL